MHNPGSVRFTTPGSFQMDGDARLQQHVEPGGADSSQDYRYLYHRGTRTTGTDLQVGSVLSRRAVSSPVPFLPRRTTSERPSRRAAIPSAMASTFVLSRAPALMARSASFSTKGKSPPPHPSSVSTNSLPLHIGFSIPLAGPPYLPCCQISRYQHGGPVRVRAIRRRWPTTGD